MKRRLTGAPLRGMEVTSSELRDTVVNGRVERLPADPYQIVAILKERRAKSPAARARIKMAAEAKARGIG